MIGSDTLAAPLLADRRGLVLGVSGERSIGFSAALALKAQGAEVMATVRPERRELGLRLREEHGIAFVELDAREEASMERAFLQVGASLGRLDFMVHTLVHVPDGVLRRAVTAITAAELTDVMEVTVRSLLVAARLGRPLLQKSSAPRIVSLLSGGADFAMPNYHAVGIAKAALAAASRYLAAELGPDGILVNAVNFSIIETDAACRVIGAEQAGKTKAYIAKRSLTGRELSLEDVTRAITYLVSPLCSNLTAQELNVDGGFSRSYFR